MVSKPDSLSASAEDAAARARAQLLDALDADDALDAQATQQLPAADRTVTDLDALDSDARHAHVSAAIPDDRPSSTLQDHPAMHDEPSVIIASERPSALAKKSHAADATGEIGIEDIVEVAEALARRPVPSRRIAPSELSEMFGAITPKKLQELADAGLLAVPAVLAPTPPTPPPMPPQPMNMVAPPPQLEPSVPLNLRPSSIAPFAVDTMEPVPARRPSMLVESTAELARAAGMPSRTTWQTIAGVAGAIALSTIALGLVGYTATHRVKTRTATVVVDTHDVSRRPSLDQQRAAAIPPPAPAAEAAGNAPRDTSGTSADATKLEAPRPSETQVTLTPEPIAATFVPAPPRRVGPVVSTPAQPATPPARPAAQPRTASPPPPPAAAPKSASAPQGTGTLRVPTTAVLVDGAPKKVVNGAVTVSCGKHVVKAPMRGTKTIDVPCGGTASF